MFRLYDIWLDNLQRYVCIVDLTPYLIVALEAQSMLPKSIILELCQIHQPRCQDPLKILAGENCCEKLVRAKV